MRVAYVDSSVFLGIVFEEPGHERIASRIRQYSYSFSANLLEAEVRAAMARESISDPSSFEFLDRINWVLPDRPLRKEIRSVLSAGYLRGADLWHLACALYLGGTHDEVELLTLDRRQLEVAERLGLSPS